MKRTVPLIKLIAKAICVFAFTLSAAPIQIRAHQQPSPCEAALSARIRELEAINSEIRSGVLSDQTVRRLNAFLNRFARDVKDPSIEEFIIEEGKGAFIGTLGELIAGAELGLLGTGAGAALAAVYLIGKRPVEIAGSWAQIDRNTAIYSWLLDYLEYGREQPITPRLSEFLEINADVLRNLTGRTPPRRPGGLLPSGVAVQRYNALARGYLKSGALRIFYFLGRFEEKAGSAKFPRQKFGDSVGRYGPSRLTAGYYRSVVAARLQSDLARLTSGLERARVACNRRPPNPAPLGPPLVVRTPSWDWYPGDTIRLAQRLQLHCAPNPERSYSRGAYGTDIYSARSSVCVAAVHAGLITFKDGGRVVIQIRPGQNSYRGSARNGVSTLNQAHEFGNDRFSFSFVR